MSKFECVDDGQLRAMLDDQLEATQSAAISAHLAACGRCAGRAEELKKGASRIAAALTSDTVDGVAAEQAFRRFEARHSGELMERPGARWSAAFQPRLVPAWASLAAVLAVAAVFSFTPSRMWAYRLLGLLRVEKVAVIPLDEPVGVGTLGNERTAQMFARILGDSVVTSPVTKPQPVASADAASAMAGFRVRLLSDRSQSPTLLVNGEQAAQIKIDRDRLQAVIDESGRSDLQLPASLNGATISVHVPKAVLALYGTCGSHLGQHVEHEDYSDPACLTLLQVPSPAVAVPADVNLSQVAAIGLELAGMSPSEAEAVCQTIDWTSTLVIPIPRNLSTSEEVTVDGGKGVLIHAHGRDNAHYALVWVKNGIIYTLGGLGDGSQSIGMADSLN